MNKKFLSLFLAVITILSSLAFCISAYGRTIEILNLDSLYAAEIDGADDQVWFTYTPDESGTYSFLSFNIPASEAYLFIKEKNPETGAKEYIQLAYAKRDPNYLENDHNQLQFCLTYHLEKGVKYYFAAGWLLDSRTDGLMMVKLRCDSYDSTEIDYFTATCSAKLDVYTNGEWKTDSNGERYFYYDPLRVLQNTTVTITYKDGSTASATGSYEVDGYRISYSYDQEQNHWYTEKDPRYTGNIVTVKILDKTVDFNVVIVSSPMFSVKLQITDYVGNPVSGAKLYNNKSFIATSDSNGYIVFSSISGAGVYRITADNALPRTFNMVVAAVTSENDNTDQPIRIVTCDYKNDGIINAKDYAIMMKNLPEADFALKSEEFRSVIHMTASDYPDLTIS